MIICNNTAPNYKECLDIALPTWKGELDLYNLDAQDFNGHCTNKILAIKECIKKHPDRNIAYLDTDVLMTGELDVFQNPQDLILTRMVRRDDNPAPEINAGVIFLRANERTLKMCDMWLELDKKLQQDIAVKYPEQQALNQIGIMGYDELIDLSVSNVSECIYNCEHNNRLKLLEKIKKYKPKLIHLKAKFWQDPEYIRTIKHIVSRF